MLLILPVLLGIALALARGGSLRQLATLPVRGVGAIVASFAIQAAIYIPAVRDTALARQGGGALYIGVLALMLFGVARNWRLGLGARFVFAGLALNTIVVAANGGHMPVNAAALRSTQGAAMVRDIAAHQKYANRMLADRSSRLLPLSDSIPVSLPFGRSMVCSFGDILIAGGAAALAYGGTRRPWRRASVGPAQTALVPPAVRALAI